jgi:hypothetical protein
MKVVALAFLALATALTVPAYAGQRKHRKPAKKAAPREPAPMPRPREKEKTAMA